MAFAYGCDNRFRDQYFVEGGSAAGSFGPLRAGDTNGGLAVVVAAKTDMAVEGLTLSLTCCDTEGGSFAAPDNADVLTFGGTAYEAGEVLGYYIIPNGLPEYVRAVIGGKLTSGTFDVYLQYIAR